MLRCETGPIGCRSGTGEAFDDRDHRLGGRAAEGDVGDAVGFATLDELITDRVDRPDQGGRVFGELFGLEREHGACHR